MTKTELGEDFGNEKDAAYDKLKSQQKDSEKAKGVLRGAGYARGGGVGRHKEAKQDKSLIKHELAKAKIKVGKKHGGQVEGKKPHGRADKYARGGSVPKGHGTHVNINLAASQADKAEAMKKGVMLGATMAARKMGAGPRPGVGAPMQARGPMPGPAPMPPGGQPMGSPGVPPTMGQKHGGRTYAKGGAVKDFTKGAGAGGGAGRLAKISTYGKKANKKD